MERRQDALFREVVAQVSRTESAAELSIVARKSTGDTRRVVFRGSGPLRWAADQELALFHAADDQYVGARLRQTGHKPYHRTQLATELWSYCPDAPRYTPRAALPQAVAAWVQTGM